MNLKKIKLTSLVSAFTLIFLFISLVATSLGFLAEKESDFFTININAQQTYFKLNTNGQYDVQFGADNIPSINVECTNPNLISEPTAVTSSSSALQKCRDKNNPSKIAYNCSIVQDTIIYRCRNVDSSAVIDNDPCSIADERAGKCVRGAASDNCSIADERAGKCVRSDVAKQADQDLNQQLNWQKNVFNFGGKTYTDGECATAGSTGFVVCRVKRTDGNYDNYKCKSTSDSTATIRFECTDKIASVVDAKTLSDLKITSDDIVNQINDNVQNNDAKEVKQANSGGVLTLLLDLVSNILLFLVWGFGWLLQGVLWVIMGVFFTFLRINPAGPEFLSVAIEPWRVIVTIANILTLAAFLYTGFQYVLGVGKKQKINDFILNIIVVLLTINFTIFAAASFVNIAQGIGDAFVGGYSIASGQANKDWGTVMFDNFINAIREVSLIRCGNVEEVTGGPTPSCKSTSGIGQVGRLYTQLFRGVGTAQAALIGEITFVVIIGYAIYVMWRGMTTALLRVVGLWMLMVTSPIALAAAFSPIPQLKKIADDWMTKFLQLTFFYPVFVLGMILVGIISKTFGQAARTQINVLTGVSDSGISVAAQGESSPNVLAGTILILVLTGFVAVGSLNILIGFMTTFDKLIAAGWQGIKDLATKSAILSGAAVRFAGGQISKSNQGKILQNNEQIQKAKNKLTDINKDLIAANKITNPQEKLRRINELNKQKKQVKDTLKSARARGAVLQKYKNYGDAIRRSGERIQAAPAVIGAIANLPKNILKNQKVITDARISGEVAGTEFDAYLQLYKSGIIEKEAIPQQYQQDILQAVANPSETRAIRDNLQRRTFNSKVSSALPRGSRATVSAAKELAKNLGSDLKAVSPNNTDLDQFLDIVSKNSSNSEVLRELAFDPQTRALVQQAVDMNLLEGDALKEIKQFPTFLSNVADKRKLAADIAGSEDNLRKFNFSALAADPELAQALFEELSARLGKDGAIAEFNKRAGLIGGFSSYGLQQAESTIMKNSANLSEAQRRVALGTVTAVASIGVGDNAIIRKLMEEVDPTTGRIDPTKADEIMEQNKVRQFGGTSAQEISSLNLAQLEETKIGRIAVEDANYSELSDEEKIETIRAASIASLEAYGIAEVIHKNLLAQSAEVYNKELDAYNIATSLSRAAIKEAKANADLVQKRFREQRKAEIENAKLVAQKVEDEYNRLLESAGNPSSPEEQANLRSQAEASRKKFESEVAEQSRVRLERKLPLPKAQKYAKTAVVKACEEISSRIQGQYPTSDPDEVDTLLEGLTGISEMISEYVASENRDTFAKDPIYAKARRLSSKLTESGLKDELSESRINDLMELAVRRADEQAKILENASPQEVAQNRDAFISAQKTKISRQEQETRRSTNNLNGDSNKILAQALR
jgi:hypothetical protein